MNPNRLLLQPLVATVILIAVAVSSAQEQPDEKPTHLMGMIALIVREPVLKELGIANDSQELAEIRQILKPFSTVLQQRLNRPTEEDRASHLTPQELYAKVEVEFVADLKTRLKPEQFARLQQIHWQRWGIRSIDDVDVASALELTPPQIAKKAAAKLEIEARRKGLEAERREQQRQGASIVEFRQRFLDLDQEYVTKYSEILTAEQLEKFAELKGKTFELVESPPAINTPPGMPVRTRPGGLMTLALLEPVLEELGIDSVAPVVMELRKMSRAHVQELRQQLASKSETVDVRENARRVESDLQAKFDIELKNLLTQDQFNRLRQIYWQRLGTEAFNEVDVIRMLEISNEQQAQLVALKLDVFRKTRELINPPEGRPVGVAVSDEIQKKIQQVVSDKDSRATQILTENQQEKWSEMKGKPFDLSRLRRSARPQSATP